MLEPLPSPRGLAEKAPDMVRPIAKPTIPNIQKRIVGILNGSTLAASKAARVVRNVVTIDVENLDIVLQTLQGLLREGQIRYEGHFFLLFGRNVYPCTRTSSPGLFFSAGTGRV